MQQLAARQRGRLACPRRRVRAGLVQLLFALVGLVLGLLLPRLSFESTVVSTRVTEALITIGFAVLGLVSVIFSLLFLVVQWAFGSLSPRLNLFRDDPIVWRTFGFAVGVFVYSVTATLAIGDRQKVSVIVPAAEVVAVLAAVALIRTLQVKAFESIQLAPTLAAIAGEGRSIIDDLYRGPYIPGGRPAASLPPLCRTVAWPRRQATLQQLDLRRLLHAAGSAVIVLRAGIGDTIQEGSAVADLHGGDVADETVLGGLVTGQERTFHQDPLFAFRLLADIGLRATIQPPPPRCWTRSKASWAAWYHVTWTWPRCATVPGPFGWSWRSRPGMTTCGQHWMISSSRVHSPLWRCCGYGRYSPTC
jgi:uncharacterized membrane protein